MVTVIAVSMAIQSFPVILKVDYVPKCYNFEVVILHRLQCIVMTHHIANIIELVGTSEKGWSEAAQAALDKAKKTVNGITGLELVDKTAKVDPATGKIIEYHAGVKIVFGVEH